MVSIEKDITVTKALYKKTQIRHQYSFYFIKSLLEISRSFRKCFKYLKIVSMGKQVAHA